jgi:hypothetical protein
MRVKFDDPSDRDTIIVYFDLGTAHNMGITLQIFPEIGEGIEAAEKLQAHFVEKTVTGRPRGRRWPVLTPASVRNSSALTPIAIV